MGQLEIDKEGMEAIEELTDDVFGDLFGEVAMPDDAPKSVAKESIAPAAIVASRTQRHTLVPASFFHLSGMKVQSDLTVFDIETGPLPADQLDALFTPPAKPTEFDQNNVKLGKMKDQAKIQAKIDAAKKAHETEVAEWEDKVAEAKDAFISKAALDPRTGQVLAVGYCSGDGQVMADWQFDECGEADLLRNFWCHYLYCKEKQSPMIGFNSNHFDLWFLILRSWTLRVEVPSTVVQGYRNFDKVFVDLLNVWSVGDRSRMISLGDLADFLGTMHRKRGSGAHFYQTFQTDLEGAIAYLKNDLLVTWECGQAMGVC